MKQPDEQSADVCMGAAAVSTVQNRGQLRQDKTRQAPLDVCMGVAAFVAVQNRGSSHKASSTSGCLP